MIWKRKPREKVIQEAVDNATAFLMVSTASFTPPERAYIIQAAKESCLTKFGEQLQQTNQHATEVRTAIKILRK